MTKDELAVLIADTLNENAVIVSRDYWRTRAGLTDMMWAMLHDVWQDGWDAGYSDTLTEAPPEPNPYPQVTILGTTATQTDETAT